MDSTFHILDILSSSTDHQSYVYQCKHLPLTCVEQIITQLYYCKNTNVLRNIKQ